MSMASGVEVRVPFADHRIFEFVFNVPWEIKFENKVLKKRVKVSNNMRKAELSHELRKIRYIIRQRKLENWKEYFKFRKGYKSNKDEYKKIYY